MAGSENKGVRPLNFARCLTCHFEAEEGNIELGIDCSILPRRRPVYALQMRIATVAQRYPIGSSPVTLYPRRGSVSLNLNR